MLSILLDKTGSGVRTRGQPVQESLSVRLSCSEEPMKHQQQADAWLDKGANIPYK